MGDAIGIGLPGSGQAAASPESADQSRTPWPLRLAMQNSDDIVDATAFRDRSVLVTGAGGSVGLDLCRKLLSLEPSRLIALDLSEAALFRCIEDLASLSSAGMARVRPVLGSAGDERLIARILKEEKVDFVLHAAAYKHVPIVEANPRSGLMNNALATHTLATLARHLDVPVFVLVSSDKAAFPAGVMGASKRLAELFVQDLASRSRSTRFSVVRFGNIAGSSGSVLPLFQSQIRRGGPVTLTDRAATRFFMSQGAATALILTAATRAGQGELFTRDMGEPVRILDLACGLIRDAGLVPILPGAMAGDIRISEIGLRPGERLHELAAPPEGEPIWPGSPIMRHLPSCPAPLAVAALLRDLREAVAADDEAALRGIVARVAALDTDGEKAGTATPGSRGKA